MVTALAADEVQPLERHAEWRAADVADPEVWTHRLTTDEIDDENLPRVPGRVNNSLLMP